MDDLFDFMMMVLVWILGIVAVVGTLFLIVVLVMSFMHHNKVVKFCDGSPDKCVRIVCDKSHDEVSTVMMSVPCGKSVCMMPQTVISTVCDEDHEESYVVDGEGEARVRDEYTHELEDDE